MTLYLNNPQKGFESRAAAARGLKEIAAHHPAVRAECVTILSRLLTKGSTTEADYELNGFIISDLMDLEAVEAAPAMERAFDNGWVEEYVAGD